MRLTHPTGLLALVLAPLLPACGYLESKERAECFALQGGSTTRGCESWTAGWERSGSYTVKAVSADGTRRTEQQLTVTEDACHVKTE